MECIKIALDVEEQQGTLPEQLQPKDTIAQVKKKRMDEKQKRKETLIIMYNRQ